ncbi:MAG: HAD-IIA family hydrolase [Mycobacterium leprae]
MTPAPAPSGLPGSAEPLARRHDVILLDLDGVVYLGDQAAPGAVTALSDARAAGARVAFVTNNASRTPEQVAAHLRALGVDATADDVVTSAQAAVAVAAARFGPAARVLVVGGEGLVAAAAAVGLERVGAADDAPVAVLQGLSLDLAYADLAEATLAVRAGARWIAANPDLTLPTARGLLPGNGALVAAVAAATGLRPTFCGKPEPPLFAEAVRRTGARCPLVVGDRLDTDIAGAARAGLPSLFVLTGVSRPRDLLAAGPGERPTYVGRDLGALYRPQPAVETAGCEARCGGWSVDLSEGRVRLAGDGDPVDGLRALAAVSWLAGGVPEDVDAALRTLGL